MAKQDKRCIVAFCDRPKAKGQLCATCLVEELNLYVSPQALRRLAREEAPAEEENDDGNDADDE